MDGVPDQADGGADEHAVLRRLQHVEALGIGPFAMVDHVDAALHRALHRKPGAGVAVHLLVEVVRGLDRRAHFRLAHHRHRTLRRIDEVVAGDVDLDVVGAFADAEARRLAHLVRPVGDQTKTAARLMQPRLVAQSAGDGDLGRGGAQPRAGPAPGVDLVARDDVEPHFRGCGAVQAGEAVIEQQRGVAHRRQQVLLGRDVAEIGVDARAAEARMRVAFHQAGHQRHAARVDRLAARRLQRRAGVGDGADAVAPDDDLARARRAAAAVEDHGVANMDIGHRRFLQDFAAAYGRRHCRRQARAARSAGYSARNRASRGA